MKRVLLAIKYIFLHFVNFINNLLLFLTNKEVDWFKKNKLKIACAIIGILFLINLRYPQVPERYEGVTCYGIGPERPANFMYGFFYTIKYILFKY